MIIYRICTTICHLLVLTLAESHTRFERLIEKFGWDGREDDIHYTLLLRNSETHSHRETDNSMQCRHSLKTGKFCMHKITFENSVMCNNVVNISSYIFKC